MAGVKLTRQQVTLLEWALRAMYRAGVRHAERLLEKDLQEEERILLLDVSQEDWVHKEMSQLAERWQLAVDEERDATCP